MGVCSGHPVAFNEPEQHPAIQFLLFQHVGDFAGDDPVLLYHGLAGQQVSFPVAKSGFFLSLIHGNDDCLFPADSAVEPFPLFWTDLSPDV